MTEGASHQGSEPPDNGAQRSDAKQEPHGLGRKGLHAGLRVGRKAGQAGLALIMALFVMAALGVLGVIALTGKPLQMPIWVVAEAEQRVNAALAKSLPGAAVSVGAVELMLDEDWTPRLRLEDTRLMQAAGRQRQNSLLSLPDLRLSFDAGALIRDFALRPSHLRIVGGAVSLRRRPDGTFDLRLANSGEMEPIGSIAELFASLDQLLDQPALQSLHLIEVEAASLSLEDARLGRTWTMGDGRIRLENSEDKLSAELSMSLVGGGALPAQALVTMVRPKGEPLVRLQATVTDVAARDLAAQTPVLGWLAPLEAPISGRISAELHSEGLGAMSADMTLGRGALRPGPEARPIRFDHAQLSLGYDAKRGRVLLNNLTVESPILRVKAEGHSYLLGADGTILTGALGRELPQAFLTQIKVSEALIDPEGLFEAPLIFHEGALDARLTLDPFKVEIGQASLIEGAGSRLTLSGVASVGAQVAVQGAPDGQGIPVNQAAGDWVLALDLGLDAIAHDRLLQLWPKTAVPRTRDWIGQNVAKGLLTDVKAALRLAPGQEAKLALGYEFDGAQSSFLRTLPPITGGRGRSSIEGRAYTLVLDAGAVEAPQGGAIDIAGSVFIVPDITQKPAQAEVRLKTDSSLTAALSLLDLPPFNFMSKAGRTPDLGVGRALVETELHLPLVRRVALQDVDYTVKGQILDVTSDVLVKGKSVRAARLDLSADPTGLRISGPGTLGRVPFDMTFNQGFGAAQKGRSTLTGKVTLSQAAVTEFGLGLPEGMVSGEGRADVTVELIQGQAGTLDLRSDLRGIALRLPQVGWHKPSGTAGKLEVKARLSQPIRVEKLSLSGSGLQADGHVELRPDGGLSKARFDRVRLSGWVDAPVEILGRAKGQAPDIALRGGTVDLRKMPDLPSGSRTGRNAAAGELLIGLDRLIVTEGISLTNFSGTFAQTGGLNGDFNGRVNGRARVTGFAVPSRHGTALRLQSNEAGEVMRDAGIFGSARGGKLDLHLLPRATKGHWDGRAEISPFWVRDANVLAELLSAISVVGLLEQLNGDGIAFNAAEADFVLMPQAVEVKQASATGASLGVSLSGIYGTSSKQLAMQGVISPIYLLNGIGAALTRQGEGLFGFDYSLRGRSDAPQVSVNPLSILTPGMFRDLFRAPPPVLRQRP